MNKLRIAVLLLSTLAASPLVLADKGSDKTALMGTLVKLEGATIVIKTDKGEEKSYETTDQTKKRGGDAPVGATIELYFAKDGKVRMIELIKK